MKIYLKLVGGLFDGGMRAPTNDTGKCPEFYNVRDPATGEWARGRYAPTGEGNGRASNPFIMQWKDYEKKRTE